MTSPILRSALAYRSIGWSVIPIGRASKMPLFQWRRYQGRCATEEEITYWWTHNPDANIGIVTGAISGIVVVDVESEVASARVPEILAQFPTSLVSRTGSGGAHLFYRHPGVFFSNRVSKSDCTDIRGDGGYVVVPPSVNAEGKEYTWNSYGLDSVPVLPLSAVPVILPKSLEKNGHSEDGWIVEALKGAGEGERNDTCAKLAGYWIRKGIPVEVIRFMMLQWNAKNTPPLPESEVVRTIESVQRTAMRSVEESFLDDTPVRTETVSTVTSTAIVPVDKPVAKRNPFSLVPFSRYMADFGGQSVNWTIEKWLPDSTITLIVAPPGTYKTWMLLDLAVSIASGTPLFGQFPVLNSGPVIIIQQEDFHGQIAERIGAVVESRFQSATASQRDEGDGFVFSQPPDLPIYFHPDRRFRFTDAEVMRELEKHIAEIRPRMVILDPLYSAGQTDDYMASTVGHMFFFKQMRDRYGCSFVIAHHTKKNDSGGQDRQELWGSQFLNAFLETGWQIRPGKKEEDSTVRIRRHFKVSPNVREETLHFEISTEAPYKYGVTINSPAVELTREDLRVAAVLAEGPSSKKDIESALADMTPDRVAKALGKMVELGKATRGVDRKYRVVE